MKNVFLSVGIALAVLSGAFFVYHRAFKTAYVHMPKPGYYRLNVMGLELDYDEVNRRRFYKFFQPVRQRYENRESEILVEGTLRHINSEQSYLSIKRDDGSGILIRYTPEQSAMVQRIERDERVALHYKSLADPENPFATYHTLTDIVVVK